MQNKYHSKRYIHEKACNKRIEREEWDFKNSQDRALRRLNVSLALECMGYMILNWYRVEKTRPSKTSQEEVIIRLEKYFRGLSFVAFQKLFARKC